MKILFLAVGLMFFSVKTVFSQETTIVLDTLAKAPDFRFFQYYGELFDQMYIPTIYQDRQGNIKVANDSVHYELIAATYDTLQEVEKGGIFKTNALKKEALAIAKQQNPKAVSHEIYQVQPFATGYCITEKPSLLTKAAVVSVEENKTLGSGESRIAMRCQMTEYTERRTKRFCGILYGLITREENRLYHSTISVNDTTYFDEKIDTIPDKVYYSLKEKTPDVVKKTIKKAKIDDKVLKNGYFTNYRSLEGDCFSYLQRDVKEALKKRGYRIIDNDIESQQNQKSLHQFQKDNKVRIGSYQNVETLYLLDLLQK